MCLKSRDTSREVTLGLKAHYSNLYVGMFLFHGKSTKTVQGGKSGIHKLTENTVLNGNNFSGRKHFDLFPSIFPLSSPSLLRLLKVLAACQIRYV